MRWMHGATSSSHTHTGKPLQGVFTRLSVCGHLSFPWSSYINYFVTCMWISVTEHVRSMMASIALLHYSWYFSASEQETSLLHMHTSAPPAVNHSAFLCFSLSRQRNIVDPENHLDSLGG
jgi:hypothetical protein